MGDVGEPGAAGGPRHAGGATAARVALVTAPDEATAEDIVARLVEEGVVACGTMLPGALSIYRWQGAVERQRETVIIFKTTAAGAARLLQRLPELHPYEVPEVLVLEVQGGHPPYLDWLADSVRTLQDRD